MWRFEHVFGGLILPHEITFHRSLSAVWATSHRSSFFDGQPSHLAFRPHGASPHRVSGKTDTRRIVFPPPAWVLSHRPLGHVATATSFLCFHDRQTTIAASDRRPHIRSLTRRPRRGQADPSPRHSRNMLLGRHSQGCTEGVGRRHVRVAVFRRAALPQIAATLFSRTVTAGAVS